MLQSIAAVALGNTEPKAEIEALWPGLEQNGWYIEKSVERIWASERDLAVLVDGLDAGSSALIGRVLEKIRSSRG